MFVDPANHDYRLRPKSPALKLGFEQIPFDEMGPDTGRIRITIDGNDRSVREQVDRWSYYPRISSLTIASGLEDKEHTVSVELLSEPPDRSVPIDEAKKLGKYAPKAFEGVALRIGWIRIMGEPIE